MTVLAFQLGNEASLFWILVVIAACFAIMAVSMAVIALMVYRVFGLVHQVQAKTEPLIQSANNIADQGKEIVEKFTELSEHLSTATKYFADSAVIIKDEVSEIRALVSQTAVTAKDKITLVSQTIERTNGQVTETADFIQSKVVQPARELAAIMAGVRRGLEVLFAPSPRQLDSVYADDEMFIG